MIKLLPTASRLERTERCPASAALPQADRDSAPARRGTAIHRFVEDLQQVGRAEALERVEDDDVRMYCAALDLDRLQPFLKGMRAEVALGLDVASGVGRELGQSMERRYDVGPSEVAGTADLMGIAPADDAVVVLDLKTGRPVVPARRNLQLGLLAAAAARAHGLGRAKVAILYLLDDGDVLVDWAELDAVDLDGVVDRVRAVVAGVNDARGVVEQGRDPDVRLGDHCSGCPALMACPGQVSLIRAIGGVGDGELGAVLGDAPAKAWALLRAAEAGTRRLRECLQELARSTPIDLGDGRVVGPVETVRHYLDGEKAYEVIARLLGEDVARALCRVETSRAAIRAGLRPLVGQLGRPLATIESEILDELRASDGIVKKSSRSVTEHSVRRGHLATGETE